MRRVTPLRSTIVTLGAAVAVISPITVALAAPSAVAAAGNFDGVGNSISGPQGTYAVDAIPADTNGDIGPTAYVQIVNEALAVFNRSTGAITYGPVLSKTIWTGFGGLCESNNDGDAVVKYDRLADRWVITQFALDDTNSSYYEFIAVSKTNDPTGAYYRYAPHFTDMNDYPKFAVWP